MGEDIGEAIPEKLATMVDDLMKIRMTKEDSNGLMAKFPRPKNASLLETPRVTEFVWSKLNHRTKQTDTQLWDFAKRTIVNGIDSTTECMVKDDVRHSTQPFLNSARNICGSRISRKFHDILQNLKNDPNIKVCAFDKAMVLL